MVIGLLTLTSIPTVTGVAVAVSEQRKADSRKEDARRMVKFHIDAECKGDTDDDRLLDGKRVVVRDEKVYLDDPHPSNRIKPSFTALSFYIDYPEPEESKNKHLNRGLGLPTHVSDNPPLLNWVYADTRTHELRYGNRTQSVEHVVGPWDWTEDERVITLEEKKTFVAVEEEEEGVWAVYFDRDGDELTRVLAARNMLEKAFVPVTLVRRVVEENSPAASSQSQDQGGQK